MSLKLKDLQDKAEAKAKEYFGDKHFWCLPSTLMAVNDALKEVDEVDYAYPMVLKAVSPLPAGFGTWEGPCGAATAGSVAIGLKFGTSDMGDTATLTRAWKMSGDWLRWFKYERFGSYDCFDIKATPYEHERCATFVFESARKLVEILTEGNPKVIR
jgi:hypothetical protein